MQESIRRIINHQYTNDKGSLEFLVPRLEICLRKDEKVSGSVEVVCHHAPEFRGYVYSSYYRMQCDESYIQGKNAHIHYCFDGKGMDYGDVINGEICVVTNLGQYYLPFQVQVMEETMGSSLGPIKNLFHFVNLAKSNWDEAVKIFYSDCFASILTGADRQYLSAYFGLSKHKYNEHNMDEFLLLTNKKQKIQFSLQAASAYYDTLIARQMGEIQIERNGWGYTSLNLSAIGDFIELEKERVTDADFLGNRCTLSYYINVDKLHSGNNFGKIIIEAGAETLNFSITVVVRNQMGMAQSYQREKKAFLLQTMDSYLRFRTKKISSKEWLAESEKIIDRMVKLHTNSIVVRLYQAQILLAKERPNEARWILSHVENMFEESQGGDEEYAYYLYLTSMYEKNEVTTQNVIEQIDKIYDKDRTNFKIYWLLLYLDDKLRADKARVYEDLQKLFQMGVNSPLVYLEAYRILEKEPRLFHKLECFEIQVLKFAVKYRILTKDVIKQATYLALKSKEDYREILRILEYGYEKFEREDTLSAICSILIQNVCTDTKYFSYFEAAVSLNLRITKLYEYYMYTIDISSPIVLPKSVMMFFSYDCNLDYEHKAFLYANVYRQKKEIQGIFASYERQIQLFVREQIEKERINEDLLFLYENFLGEIEFDEALANHFVQIAFKNKVFVEDEQVRNVVVVHEQLKEESLYPVSGNRAYVSIYTKESCVLFEDGRHNRYVIKEQSYEDSQLLFKKLAYLIGNFKLGQLGFLLYLCENRKMYSVIDGGNVHAYATLLLDKQPGDPYKQVIGSKLLKYYYDNDYMDELSKMVQSIRYENVKCQDRSDIVRYMVVLELYDLAYEFALVYGLETIAPKFLLKICEYKLNQMEKQKYIPLVQMCYYVFSKGKYNEQILKYLLMYFEGTMKQMKDIWLAAVNSGVNTREIESRILGQFLLCGGFLSQKEKIFSSYAERAGQADDLMRAYISKSCYDYFVKDYVVGEELFAEVLRFMQYGEDMPSVCKLAFIKYFSQLKQNNEKISLEERYVIVKFLNELIQGKMFFSFFFAFKEWVPMMLTCVERTYVEYRTTPGCKVTIHYLIAREGKVVSDYKQEVMREMFDGYYTKSFCLFFSEHLQYYITKEQDGEETLVESGEVEKLDASDMQKETRFALLNDMLVSEALQDYDTTTQLMKEYSNKVWFSETFLDLM